MLQQMALRKEPVMCDEVAGSSQTPRQSQPKVGISSRI